MAEPARGPSEEVLAMAWGDLHSVSNSWPVTIELQDERNQMELEDHLATQQRQMDQDERNQMELDTMEGHSLPFVHCHLLVYLAALYARGGSFQKLL